MRIKKSIAARVWLRGVRVHSRQRVKKGVLCAWDGQYAPMVAGTVRGEACAGYKQKKM